MTEFGLNDLEPNQILRDLARAQTIKVSSVGECMYTAEQLVPKPAGRSDRVKTYLGRELGITVRRATETERREAGY